MITIEGIPTDIVELIYPHQGYWTIYATVAYDSLPVLKMKQVVSVQFLDENKVVLKTIKGTITNITNDNVGSICVDIRASAIDWDSTVKIYDFGDSSPTWKQIIEKLIEPSHIKSTPPGRVKSGWHTSNSNSIVDHLDEISNATLLNWWVNDDGKIEFGIRNSTTITKYTLSQVNSGGTKFYNIVNFIETAIPTPGLNQEIGLFQQGRTELILVVKNLFNRDYQSTHAAKFANSYACQITKQNGKYCDVFVADKTIDEGKGIKNAILNHGPGCTIEFESFPVNAVLSFVGGDPQQPQVTSFSGIENKLKTLSYGTASDFVALSQKVLDEHNLIKADLDALKTYLSLLFTYFSTAVCAAPGSPLVPVGPPPVLVLTYSPASVACTKLKTE